MYKFDSFNVLDSYYIKEKELKELKQLEDNIPEDIDVSDIKVEEIFRIRLGYNCFCLCYLELSPESEGGGGAGSEVPNNSPSLGAGGGGGGGGGAGA